MLMKTLAALSAFVLLPLAAQAQSFASLSGTEAGFGENFTATGGLLLWELAESDVLGAGHDFNAVTITGAPLPEPSTYALMLAGLGLAAWFARRRRPLR
jgi:hypothetical protein